jgi:periplasmic divalent cation tolerance protein
MYDGRLMVCSTTFPDRAQAQAAVTQLVSEGLVVCGQVGADLMSCYRWQGKICHDNEVAVMLKVRDDRLDDCWQRLRVIHPYETPQLLAWRADRVDEVYGRWAYEEDTTS